MSDALQRGSVVLRRGQYGVVWQVDGAELVLHPVTPPSDGTKISDVALTLGELIGAGIVLGCAVVRCGEPIRVATDGQQPVGALAGASACRVSVAVARAYAAARMEALWEGERRHRNEARSTRPVRLVG